MKEPTQRELLIRIDERQQQILNHLKELNGQVDKNQINIRRMAIGVMLGSVIWIKESRDVVLGALASVIGL